MRDRLRARDLLVALAPSLIVINALNLAPNLRVGQRGGGILGGVLFVGRVIMPWNVQTIGDVHPWLACTLLAVTFFGVLIMRRKRLTPGLSLVGVLFWISFGVLGYLTDVFTMALAFRSPLGWVLGYELSIDRLIRVLEVEAGCAVAGLVGAYAVRLAVVAVARTRAGHGEPMGNPEDG